MSWMSLLNPLRNNNGKEVERQQSFLFQFLIIISQLII
jgi:hypothetical protein